VVTVAEIREEVVGSAKLSDYEAVDVLWVALVKAANMHAGRNEHERMISLVNSLPEAQLAVLPGSGVKLIDFPQKVPTIVGSFQSFLQQSIDSYSYWLSPRAVLACEFVKSTHYFLCPRLDAEQGSGAIAALA
jgi:hypothetical protein